LARDLLTSPMLMFHDEPTTGLDPRSEKDVHEVIRSIKKGDDSSILLCTHEMGEAEELCDRVGILLKEVLMVRGSAAELKAQYGSESLEDVFMRATGTSLEEAEFSPDELKESETTDEEVTPQLEVGVGVG